jgi:hypothetical protein
MITGQRLFATPVITFAPVGRRGPGIRRLALAGVTNRDYRSFHLTTVTS